MATAIESGTGSIAFLTLAQWFSPGYPVGAFAYSHGLEMAISDGALKTALDLDHWIRILIDYGSGRSDALFLSAAYLAPDIDAVRTIDATARAFAPSRERLMETELMGSAFCQTTATLHGLDLHGLTYPVAVGRATSLCGLPQQTVAAWYLHAFAANLVSAAVRAVPLGQTEGQAVLSALHPLCETVARETLSGDLDALSGTAFAADIASMTHETLYSRSFRT
ncbi:urease accessory protein UreF [Chachezhania antarctica]|uniref:urease accessory protein UreF n=1 Tax=Chachezhania antarctica TaxID=2340860 RepID=UPI001F0894A4|nr:urease accessory UreF family protein [Chachezhania antarctica]|tara:strand:- start:4912 stop:5580 length:669 start_codon:yes stop_codon:yes gene_type:complete